MEQQPTDEQAKTIENFIRLLKTIGDPGECKACHAPIFWVLNPKTQKRMPITLTGLNHFADCPNAAQFRNK